MKMLRFYAIAIFLISKLCHTLKIKMCYLKKLNNQFFPKISSLGNDRYYLLR